MSSAILTNAIPRTLDLDYVGWDETENYQTEVLRRQKEGEREKLITH